MIASLSPLYSGAMSLFFADSALLLFSVMGVSVTDAVIFLTGGF